MKVRSNQVNYLENYSTNIAIYGKNICSTLYSHYVKQLDPKDTILTLSQQNSGNTDDILSNLDSNKNSLNTLASFVGLLLIELLTEVNLLDISVSRTSATQICNSYLPCPEIKQYIQKKGIRVTTLPKYLPMIVKPKDHDVGCLGGYLLNEKKVCNKN